MITFRKQEEEEFVVTWVGINQLNFSKTSDVHAVTLVG